MNVVEQVIFETRDPYPAIQKAQMKIKDDFGFSAIPLVHQVVDVGEEVFLVIINVIENDQ